ncbi:MAG: GntR family transcriptional regulator [Clostridiales bacterium]|jgi:K+/H+ antiporter YhaU regulatory subunit KhtT|nr:GntR family transcriptional regulator [Clostridiales bacterium]
MDKEQKITNSVYRKISIDIARDIANGKYMEGQKLYGRSMLASQYKVSPETIRKAVYILKDMGILDTERGSGVEVVSVSTAKEFVQRYNEVENLTVIKSEITQWAQKQVKETSDIINKIRYIVDAAERFRSVSPFTPYEIVITAESTVIGKTLDELRFWHNTGGTIIAMRRDENLIVSPGPYATFNAGDIFYMIGNDQSYMAARKLLYE